VLMTVIAVSRPALGPTQPPVQGVPGVKRPKREVDHSPPSGAGDNKNDWSCTSTPLHVFVAWCSVKHGDNFSFTFTAWILP
jgi:hypothetical protein